MADDRDARIAQLEAELQLLHELRAVDRAENARLRAEGERCDLALTEALEHQTATTDVLRIIATAPADLRAVLHAVAEGAIRVCGAQRIAIFQRDGDTMRRFDLSRHLGGSAFWDQRPDGVVPLAGDFVAGRAVLEQRTIQVANLMTDTEYPLGQQMAASGGFRTNLAVP
ncbi:MAG TPA: GAF domain-containing protein, partial [Chloroflexota bacterium]|nr:GAF domain-containing protein [Chloroflexota bacterium]